MGSEALTRFIGFAIEHAVMALRWLKKRLAEERSALETLEAIEEKTLPQYRDTNWQQSESRIPAVREEIAKLEREIAEQKEIKTPETSGQQSREWLF